MAKRRDLCEGPWAGHFHNKRQGGGFLPLLMAALPAVGAALGTGALSGAAGFGTQALLNELA